MGRRCGYSDHFIRRRYWAFECPSVSADTGGCLYGVVCVVSLSFLTLFFFFFFFYALTHWENGVVLWSVPFLFRWL